MLILREILMHMILRLKHWLKEKGYRPDALPPVQVPQSVALAWLQQRSPNILLIPGTPRRAHLRDNMLPQGCP